MVALLARGQLVARLRLWSEMAHTRSD
jgi:hypothetical protein